MKTIANPYKKMPNKGVKKINKPYKLSSLKKKKSIADKAIANTKRVTFKLFGSGLKGIANLGNNCCYLSSLANVSIELRRFCRARELHDSARYFQRAIKCFIKQRLSLRNLIDALFELIKTSTAGSLEDLAYVTRILSCAETMIRFDTFSGNKASFNVIFGTKDVEGAIEKALRNLKLVSKDVGLTSLKKLKVEAKRHIELVQSDIQTIAKSINAPSNGVNFTMRIPLSDGATKYIWPRGSNYMTGSDYEIFQVRNGGTLPVSRDGWNRFIANHIKSPFENDRKAKSELLKENGVEFDDFSIRRLKSM